jgi:hypothetical protein
VGTSGRSFQFKASFRHFAQHTLIEKIMKSFTNLQYAHLYFASQSLSRSFVLGLGLIAAIPSFAGEGHDHGDKPSEVTAGKPRFTASSDQFELVGVINDKTITLYLDHFVTNEPVKKATLTLDIDGKSLAVKPISDGLFEAALPAPFKSGTMAVSATLTAGNTTDLLAGELDLHDQSPKTAAHGGVWDWVLHALPWAAGVLVLVAFAWLMVRRFMRRTSR